METTVRKLSYLKTLRLRPEESPLFALCPRCGQTFHPTRVRSCPRCGSKVIDILDRKYAPLSKMAIY